MRLRRIAAAVAIGALWLPRSIAEHQNLALFIGGVACLDVGLHKLSPAAAWIATGLILMALVFLASPLPQPTKEHKR